MLEAQAANQAEWDYLKKLGEQRFEAETEIRSAHAWLENAQNANSPSRLQEADKALRELREKHGPRLDELKAAIEKQEK